MESITSAIAANAQAIANVQGSVGSISDRVGNVDDIQVLQGSNTAAAMNNANSAINSNLLVGPPRTNGVTFTSTNNVARPLAATVSGPTIVDGINLNTQLITQNSADIQINRSAITQSAIEILDNRQRVESLSVKLDQMGAVLAANTKAIEELNGGLAAVVALPNVTLGKDEDFALSGGFSLYGEKIGFGGAIAIRASENWSIGLTVGHGGSKTTGAIRFRFAK